jgi:inner membrane protein
MMGPTHAATGAAAWIVLGPLFHVNPAAVVATIPVAALAALGPDIDHRGSTIGRLLWFISWPLSKVTEHRVEMHSFSVALLIVGMLYPFAGLTITGAVAAGWIIGHVGADCLTVQGCAVWWPLSRKKSRIGFMTTGEVGERIYTFLLLPIVFLYYIAAIRGGWLA